MAVKDLEFVFRPESIVVLHSSGSPEAMGRRVVENARAGFAGPVFEVEFFRLPLIGSRTAPGLDSLSTTPHLAILCLAPDQLPDALDLVGERGVRAALIPVPVPAALRGEGDASLLDEIRARARRFGMRIVGPGSMGVLVPAVGLNAGTAHVGTRSGAIGFVAESPGLCDAMLDWADACGAGFSSLIHLGQAIDVDLPDVLDFLGSDPATRAVIAQFDRVRSGRRFLSAARGASRNKAVVAMRVGAANPSARTATTDLGRLLTQDEVYDAALRRAGIVRIPNVEGLFDAIGLVGGVRTVQGDRLAIVCNDPGLGQIAVDFLVAGGGRVAPIGRACRDELARMGVAWAPGRAIELPPDAPPEAYGQVLERVDREDTLDALLLVHAPNLFAPADAVVQAVGEGVARSQHAVITCWPGGTVASRARAAVEAFGLPAYPTPEKAVNVFLGVSQYQRLQKVLLELPPSRAVGLEPDEDEARRVIAGALAAGRTRLDEAEVRRILAAYGVPLAEAPLARSGADAARLAAGLGFPVALRAQLSDEAWQPPGGLWAHHLESAEAVRDAARTMRRPYLRRADGVRVTGFSVRRMDPRPGARRLAAGVVPDAVFGPVLVLSDAMDGCRGRRTRGVALLPLNMALASELIDRLRLAEPTAEPGSPQTLDTEALARTLVCLSQLIADIDEVAEVEIDPLLCDADGLAVAEASIRVVAAMRRRGARRLAIRPYPRDLESVADWNGGTIRLRPIRPEDEEALAGLLEALDPVDLRFRFFSPLRQVPRSQLARFTQIDYDREISLVALEDEAAGGRMLGEARIVGNVDREWAEFAIVVRSDVAGRGLGHLLLARLVAVARAEGYREMRGETMPENTRMRALARSLGFREVDNGDPRLIHLRLPLGATGNRQGVVPGDAPA